MLNYPVQNTWFALGTDAAGVTLTTAYAGNISTPVPSGNFSQLTVCFNYVPGAGGGGNSVQIKVEGSPDLLDNGVTLFYYQETSSATVSGTVTHTLAEHTFTGAVAGTSYKGLFYVPPSFSTVRFSAKETVVGGSAGVLRLRIIAAGF